MPASTSSNETRSSSPSPRRILLITGAGQPSGIGQAIARNAVLYHNYSVVLGVYSSHHNAEQLESFVTELNETSGGHHAIWVPCDVTEWASLQSLFTQALSTFGGIDAVLCNAGIAAPYRKTTFGQSERPTFPTLDVNLTGALYTLETAMAFFAAHPRPGQTILTTASMAGINPIPANPVYSASKFAVIGATMSFARRMELTKKPVRVNAIAPYYVRTNLCPTAFVEKIGEANLVPMEAVVEVAVGLLASESESHGVVAKVQPAKKGAGERASIEMWRPAEVDFYGIPL